MTTTRVVVVDDHRLLREALVELVTSEPGFEVLAAVGDVASVAPHLEQADLLLLDLSLPGGGALELVRRLNTEGRVRTIIVSMHQSPEYVRSAFASGAAGYVFKQSTSKHLFDAIDCVMTQGRNYVDPNVAAAVELADYGTSPSTPTLTERETTVLVELARGQPYKAIAEQLGIGVRTVETYRRRVTEKLGLRSRADLVRYATELGLLAAASDGTP